MPPPPLPKHHPSHTPENSAAIMQLKNDMADMFANFPGVTMERVFRALDNDHSGVLDQVEFMCGLADLGADVSQEDALKLFSAIDTDGSGQMDYMEFVNWFAAKSPPPPPARNGFRAQISSEEMATDIAQAAAQQVKQVISSEELAASTKAASEKRPHGGDTSGPKEVAETGAGDKDAPAKSPTPKPSGVAATRRSNVRRSAHTRAARTPAHRLWRG